MLDRSTEAGRLALDWFNGDEDATRRVDELLAQAGLSAADVSAQSLSTNAREFDRLDAQNQKIDAMRFCSRLSVGVRAGRSRLGV
jgi:hypothetical protein